MSTDTYPADSGPLPVPAGAAGPLVPFTERAGADSTTGRLVMFLRVVRIGDADGPAPGLRLAAGAGPATDVGTAPTPLHGDPGAAPVALATRTDEPDAITVVEVEVLQPDQPWQLQIVNRDGADHRYVWVVADTDDATRRPWLDLPTPELAFRTAVGETVTPQDLTVANHGTGPLTLDDPDGTDLGAGFTLLSVTPRTIGPRGRGRARIAFTTPAAAAQLTIAHALASNDPAAGRVDGHRNRVSLAATVHAAPRWARGDILLLGEYSLERLDRASGPPEPVSMLAAGILDVAVDPATGDAVLLYVGSVVRVNRLTGEESVVPVPGLVTPVAVAVDGGGAVAVLDVGSRSLVRIAPDGTRTDTVAAVLEHAWDLAVEANGDAVVTGVEPGQPSSRGTVWRIDRAGSTTVVGTDHSVGSLRYRIRPLAVERDGTILVGYQSQSFPGPFNAASLIRVGPRSGQARSFVVDSRELTNPVSLAVAADGTVLVSGGLALFAVHPQTGVPTRLTNEHVAGGAIAVVPPLPGVGP
jgi:hypothetical protein